MNKAIQVFVSENMDLGVKQETLLDSEFGKGEWEVYSMPALGWSITEMKALLEELSPKINHACFLHPVPYLLMNLAYRKGKEPANNPGVSLLTWESNAPNQENNDWKIISV